MEITEDIDFLMLAAAGSDLAVLPGRIDGGAGGSTDTGDATAAQIEEELRITESNLRRRSVVVGASPLERTAPACFWECLWLI